MAKKSKGRQTKSRQKTRPNRPTAPRVNGATAVAEDDEGMFAESPVLAPPVPAPKPAVARSSASPARRTANPGRALPSTVINYAYLRRDITFLAILAPAMIVLVIVAFFLFH